MAVPIEMFSDVNLWEQFEISKSGAEQEFCEFHGYDRLIRQPSNSWSNLIYLFFGCLYFVYAYRDKQMPVTERHNFVTRYTSYSIVLGVVMVFLCFASFLFHASLTEFGRKLDITGVVASASILLSYSFLRLYGLRNFRKSQLLFLRTYKLHILGFIGALIAFFLSGLHGREVVTGLILSVVGLNLYTQWRYKPKVKIWYFIAAIGSILTSTALWELDKEILCDPSSVFQLHAVWHILTGVTVFLVYWFYRTEMLFRHHIKEEN